MDRETLGKRRLKVLVKQLMDETGSNQSEVARRIGCNPSMVNHILMGRRDGGDKLIPRAMDMLKLRPEFFYDPKAGDVPLYRSYVRSADPEEAARARAKPIVEAFLAGPDGSRVSAEHRDRLLASSWGGLPGPLTVALVREAWLGMRDEDPSAADLNPTVAAVEAKGLSIVKNGYRNRVVEDL